MTEIITYYVFIGIYSVPRVPGYYIVIIISVVHARCTCLIYNAQLASKQRLIIINTLVADGARAYLLLKVPLPGSAVLGAENARACASTPRRNGLNRRRSIAFTGRSTHVRFRMLCIECARFVRRAHEHAILFRKSGHTNPTSDRNRGGLSLRHRKKKKKKNP